MESFQQRVILIYIFFNTITLNLLGFLFTIEA